MRKSTLTQSLFIVIISIYFSIHTYSTRYERLKRDYEILRDNKMKYGNDELVKTRLSSSSVVLCRQTVLSEKRVWYIECL